MSETEDFLESVLPRLAAADTALHNGDAGPRMAIWSRDDPVTLVGAVLSGTGWDEIAPVFQWLASRFSTCKSFEIEVIAADARGDLGYLVAIERTTASVGGTPETYALRVTTILRREGGEWKVVHRHADPVSGSGSATDQLAALRPGTT